MKRFFIDNINFCDKHIVLNDPVELHHLKDVLRVKLYESVAVFDNSGNEYIVLVVGIGHSSAKLKIERKLLNNGLGAKITVACAIPKNSKMDDIIDKLTQLGVECIIPLETKRVIVRLNKQKKLERLARWNKIALSAAKQSQRNRVPIVKPVCGLNEAIVNTDDFSLKLIPTLEGERKPLKELINNAPKKINSAIALIGPEGDFTPDEVALAKEAGFIPVSLGREVLRVDTAAIALVSFIKLNEEN